MEQKSFLERLQSADEKTKTWLLILASGVVTAIVVFVWVRYMNGLLGENAAPPVADANGDHGFSVWQSAKDGVALFFHGIIDKTKSLGSVLGATKNYDIHPPQ